MIWHMTLSLKHIQIHCNSCGSSLDICNVFRVQLWFGLLCDIDCILIRHLFMQEVKLKNAGSWSSLASLAVSQTSGSSSVKKSTTAMSFELFKKAAKEKEERVGGAVFAVMFFVCDE